MPVVKVSKAAEDLVVTNGPIGSSVKMTKLLQLSGLASSAGEATRKLAENAVSVNGEKFAEKVINLEILGESPTLRLGKKSVRLEWTN